MMKSEQIKKCHTLKTHIFTETTVTSSALSPKLIQWTHKEKLNNCIKGPIKKKKTITSVLVLKKNQVQSL